MKINNDTDALIALFDTTKKLMEYFDSFVKGVVDKFELIDKSFDKIKDVQEADLKQKLTTQEILDTNYKILKSMRAKINVLEKAIILKEEK